jgi:hypothetical protein
MPQCKLAIGMVVPFAALRRHAACGTLCWTNAHLKIVVYCVLLSNVSAHLQEQADMGAGWSCIDLKVTLAHARAMALDADHLRTLEAEAHSLMGLVWDRMLLKMDLAIKSYRRAMDAAMEMHPRPVNKPWYKQLRKCMSEIQAKARMPLATATACTRPQAPHPAFQTSRRKTLRSVSFCSFSKRACWACTHPSLLQCNSIASHEDCQ